MNEPTNKLKDEVYKYGIMMIFFLISGYALNYIVAVNGITNESIILITKAFPITGLFLSYIRFPIIALAIASTKKRYNTVSSAVGTLFFYLLFGVFSVFVLSDFEIGAMLLLKILKALVIIALLSIVEGTVNLLIHKYNEKNI